jgi:hypothetical protein
MFANSLLIRFSSSSRARAFLRSAMKDTKPAPNHQSPVRPFLQLNVPRIVGTLPDELFRLHMLLPPDPDAILRDGASPAGPFPPGK